MDPPDFCILLANIILDMETVFLYQLARWSDHCGGYFILLQEPKTGATTP